MGVNLQTILQDLKQKVVLLSARYQKLLKEKEAADSKIEDLKTEIALLRENLEKEKTDNHFLILSHRLASDPDSLIRSRRTISKLIRDIDKCITQLKE